MHYRRRNVARLVRRAVVFCLPAVWACGPLNATRAVSKAETAVARARTVDAERIAPYETISAELYLDKAREEQGRAQYAEAERLANESAALADRASIKAGELRDTSEPARSTATARPPEGNR